VIHKDLKPENVMMSSEGGFGQETHIVVVDFGLSEMFDTASDRKQEISGTPPFMAPEVWNRNFSKKCDVWSCGVILFYMLSGMLPFIAHRVEDFPATVSRDPSWQAIGGASEKVQMICKRMLSRRESERPGAQELMCDQWFMMWGLGVDSIQLIRKHLHGLIEVKQRSHFEKFVSRLVATQLDSGKQKLINEAFRAFDIDKDGVLSFEEIAHGLNSLGVPWDEASQVADELDIGKSGYVSYTEFLAGVMDLRHRSQSERDKFLWLAWQQFSPDDKHMVRIHAIQDALAARGLTVAELPREFLRLLQRGTSQEMGFEDFRNLFQADEQTHMQSGVMQSSIMQSGIMNSRRGEVV
jgi:serine/threonine protein kinase